MKPLTRSGGWFRSRVLPRIRKGEPLTLASVWLLCTSCSFNNSFQDGCLGNIRISVPTDKKRGAAGSKKPPRGVPTLRASAKTSPQTIPDVTVAAMPTSGIAAVHTASKAAFQLISNNWPAWQKGVPPEQSKTPVKVAAPAAPTLPEPPTIYKQAPRAHTLLPGIVHLLFWEQTNERSQAYSVPTLRNGERPETWQERPESIKLCFHTQDPNAGWTRFHIARNTYQAAEHCRAGHPLGSGRHWSLVDDTFAASASPCRVFFSPARSHIVAQCGTTIYRSSIRRAARCLQIGQGKGCEFPHATLHKMPAAHVQPVEWQPR